MRQYSLFLLISIFSCRIVAQSVGINTNAPDPSAILEVQGTNGGFLGPRLTTIQRNAITTPAEGLQIYNLTDHCMQYYNGTSWVGVGCCTPQAVAPSSVSATVSGVTATISFSGGAGTTYTVTSSPGGFTASGASSPITINGLASSTSYTFTVVAISACGTSSPSAPSNSITTAAYQPGSQTFAFTGSPATFVVPSSVTSLTVEAWGASGGRNGPNSANGGLGAYAKSTYTVVPGESITIRVGGQGANGVGSIAGGGGGGGSFVSKTSGNVLLVVAGGGGGASYTGGAHGGNGTSTQTSGAGGYSTVSGGGGGMSDNGGGGGTGAGGGGWNSAGTTNSYATGGAAAGGAGGNGGYSNPGGFGGGGGSFHGGGGGGGYSGGSGGSYTIGGGGGASYTNGTNSVMTQGVQNGSGQVILTW
jgi:hypothetical protein